MKLQALLLDCDGVLAETERDGHRVAFNRAFAEHGLDIEWSAELYRELLQVAGGKERMRAWFERAGWPAAATDRDAFIRLLHATKTRHFLSIVAAGGLRARPGVRRIIDEALASGVRIAICSTSDERSVRAVTRSVLGVDRAARLAGIYAGDQVTRKKPDPDIYQLAARELDLAPEGCLVIEDSEIGLRAARGAGMRCVITTSAYTVEDDFAGACLVLPQLGDPPGPYTGLEQLAKS
jgi:HAD superfamily hydrolase (TIGR01509 family)